MIWINYAILVLIEAFIHSGLINKGIDPTPVKTNWLKASLLSGRVVLASIPWFINEAFFGHGIWSLEFLMYFLGCLFFHLLVFPLALNRLRKPKKPWGYLSTTGIDGLVLWATKGYFPGRILSLGILASGFMYAFYHTYLL